MRCEELSVVHLSRSQELAPLDEERPRLVREPLKVAEVQVQDVVLDVPEVRVERCDEVQVVGDRSLDVQPRVGDVAAVVVDPGIGVWKKEDLPRLVDFRHVHALQRVHLR